MTTRKNAAICLGIVAREVEMPTKQENKEDGGEERIREGVGAKINFRGHIAYRSPK